MARSLAKLCLALWLPLVAHAEAPAVIVLSWDGVRHDFPERAETPGLDRMARDGLRAARLVPVFPSNTFPSHVSLATGTFPDRHGIVGNTFRDRRRGLYRYSNDASWLRAEPLWIAAERQGVRAATFFWVGSETDWKGRGASYRRAPFDSAVPESEKVQQILDWLDLGPGERPGLILSWWHGTDHVAHAHGPDHPEVARQLAAQDRQLERLLAGIDHRELWSRLTLFVVSDHGITKATRAFAAGALLAEHGIEARVLPAGGAGHVFLDDPAQAEVARELLDAQPGVWAYPSAALPEELRASCPERCGDLVVRVEPPLALSRRALAAGNQGMHGYHPEHPDMAAIFYALGRGVPAGAAPARVRAVDLAASVAQLLGIEPPQMSEGTPLPELRTGAR